MLFSTQSKFLEAREQVYFMRPVMQQVTPIVSAEHNKCVLGVGNKLHQKKRRADDPPHLPKVGTETRGSEGPAE